MTYPEAKTPQAVPPDSISLGVWIGYVVLLAALCAISFHGVVELGVEAEDQEYIGDARRVLDGSGTLFSTGRTYAGRPTGEVVFVAAYALWEESAVAYHVLVVLLHFCASILTAKVLVELGIPIRVGAAAGVLFAVHVPHYQVVHWVSSNPPCQIATHSSL
jgi:hypothetical protein